MSSNSLGDCLRLTTFGESHGSAVGGILDGVPAGIALDMESIYHQMARRRPGQSFLSTDRNEEDQPEFLSGIFEGISTGAPIAFLIRNKDVKSADYDHLKEVFRPGHADYTFQEKFGVRDHRGGGRSSARTMAPWVCAGAIAEQILNSKGILITAWVSQVGTIELKGSGSWSRVDVDRNAVRCPNPELALEMESAILEVKKQGDSLGGVISARIDGMPVGIGEPQFKKLPAQLAHAMFSINAVKGFELGAGFELAAKKGSEANDAFYASESGIKTKSNQSGGVLGGISNGMPIEFKVAFKPVSTIGIEQETVNRKGEDVLLEAKGRHDPCVVPRAVPIVEAMSALVICDLWMMYQARK
ncbi:MAG: chorismate synthase [Bacteroidota bacterium]|nr:chorismate synthase [Bacteroidota bacterium]MDX5429440.1 chorismate synthase [Bacteroidota bacterium]MDX5468229.1 chorismate synthase [Bacteroidota bacterium]